MKVEILKKRLNKECPMTTTRMPEDVIQELKQIASLLVFWGYQPLIGADIGQGLRTDLEQLEDDKVSALVASLKRHRVSDEVLQTALMETTIN